MLVLNYNFLLRDIAHEIGSIKKYYDLVAFCRNNPTIYNTSLNQAKLKEIEDFFSYLETYRCYDSKTRSDINDFLIEIHNNFYNELRLFSHILPCPKLSDKSPDTEVYEFLIRGTLFLISVNRYDTSGRFNPTYIPFSNIPFAPLTFCNI